MEELLKAAFIEALGVAPGTDFAKLRYRGIPEWDSVAHMQLVNAIENRFGIMLETDEVIGMDSFIRAREIIAKYGAAP
jgi:acyl carrier protein